MTHDTANEPRIKRPTRPHDYRIVVMGHLDMGWADCFDGLTLTHTPDDRTRLEGLLVDQSALFGVLKRIHGLGLTLVSINPHPVQRSD